MERETNEQMAISVPAATKTTLLAATTIGLVLMTIGSSTRTEWAITIGALVLSFSAFWGGFFLREDHVAVRVVLIAVGAFVAVSAFLGSAFALSSFLR